MTFFYFQGPPYFTRAPSNATLRVGEDVILPCQANGDPPPKTRWRRIGPGYPPDGKSKSTATTTFWHFGQDE